MASPLNAAMLFTRDSPTLCQSCPPDTPSCPTCPGGQICSLIPQSCDQCAHAVCVNSGVSTGTPSSAPNVGAIAGGVVGGVAFIAIVTFLIWWFWIRPRRELEEEWEQEEFEREQEENEIKSQFREARSRASVHTVRSVASTVMSRASNMIPIAFIPGVTNASSGGTPPVPPIPAARGYSQSNYSNRTDGDAIFFSPGDLRNSAYSHVSTLADRKTFFGRHSITPSLARESVTSEVYLDDGSANPMPAQQAVMSRPHVVSVRSSPQVPQVGSPDSSVVGVVGGPSTTTSGPRVVMPSTSQGSRSISTFTKPQIVNLRNKSQRYPVLKTGSAASNNDNKPSVRSPLADTDTEDDDDEDPHARARKSLLRRGQNSSLSVTSSPTSTTMLQSPFTDDNVSSLSLPSSSKYTSGKLSAVIEEATRRASEMPGRNGAKQRDVSPFGDEHSVKKGDD